MINKSKVAFWAFIVLISMVGYLPAEEPDYGDDYATAEPIVTDGTIMYGTIGISNTMLVTMRADRYAR